MGVLCRSAWPSGRRRQTCRRLDKFIIRERNGRVTSARIGASIKSNLEPKQRSPSGASALIAPPAKPVTIKLLPTDRRYHRSEHPVGQKIQNNTARVIYYSN